MELKTLITEYLNTHKTEFKLKTYLCYEQLTKTHIVPYYENVNTEILTEAKINQHIVHLSKTVSTATVKMAKGLLNRTLTWAYSNKLMQTKILASTKVVKVTRRTVEALTHEEQQRLTKYIIRGKKTEYYGILLSMYTGLRIGELLALKWEMVDFANNIIIIKSTRGEAIKNNKMIKLENAPKTASSLRVLPISTASLKLLRELKKLSTSNYVITGKRTQMPTVRNYQQMFYNLQKKLNLKHYGFHSLRHTFATTLLQKGIDIKTISELMGHSSPTITLNMYVHTDMQQKIKAMNCF